MKNIRKFLNPTAFGFTLIELLAVIVILAVIALIATPIILGIISNAKKEAFKNTAYGVTKAAENAFVEMMYSNTNPVDISYFYNEGVESSSPAGYALSYSGTKPKNGQISLTKGGKVSLTIHDGKWCATKGYDNAKITVEEKTLEECMPPIVDQSGANAPVLAQGMTPIMWDGFNWIPASNIDDPYKQNWYDYEEKKWANARTNDGSMWVWIPRYAYQIATGYHTSTAGTINIKFLENTSNTAKDATTVATTPTYSDADTQSNYIVHPAFDFGGTQLTGMWVAKFEMSGTTSSLDSKPGVSSLRSILLGEMFIASRNMETNNKYGWALASGLNNTTGVFSTNTNNVDVHMMKNTEWGLAAYLSHSIYGKNSEIYINNSSTYITGCSGGNTSAPSYSGCQYTYDTVQGQGASTTGTIYGIYDISGGADEYVMGNFDNTAGSSGLTPSSISDKYIDRYTAYNNTKYGDALYETSTSTSGITSWYSDYSKMIYVTGPWMYRGGYYGSVLNGTYSGAFSFEYDYGEDFIWHAFRVVVVVGTGF